MTKIYLRDLNGCTASITEQKDGTAKLVVRIYTGAIIHNKIHKNVRAAKAAWNRMN